MGNIGSHVNITSGVAGTASFNEKPGFNVVK
jgi:hypothetical protein